VADPDEWLRGAEPNQGTWWTDIAAWLDDRSGALRPAPTELGRPGLPSLADAPGTYVFDN